MARKGKPKARRQKRRGRPKSAVKHGSSRPTVTTGSLILSGIRTVLSMIPGATTLSEISDFVFKSIGIIKGADKSETYVKKTIDIIGLGGSFMPKYINIIGSSPLAERSMGTKDHNGIQWVNCEYYDAQLISMSITIAPVNPQSNRSGSWCLSFTPFRASEDEASYKAAKAVPEYITMSHMLGAVSGPANKPLTLAYRPGVSEGYISQYHGVDTAFGVVCIAYEDLARQSADTFKAAEFACDIRLKGSVRVRSSYVLNNADGHSDDMIDLLKNVGAAVRCGNNAYQILAAKDFKCETSTSGRCLISGNVSKTYTRMRGSLHCREVEDEMNDMELV